MNFIDLKKGQLLRLELVDTKFQYMVLLLGWSSKSKKISSTHYNDSTVLILSCLTGAVVMLSPLTVSPLGFNTRRRHVRWSCGHQVRQVGFLRALCFPLTQRPPERKHRCQRA